MEKFKFKPYNSSIDAGVFTMGNGYFESSGEADTRKQLSYPLSNIADYINDEVVPNVNESINSIGELDENVKKSIQELRTDVKTTTDSLKNDVSVLNGRVDTVTSLPSGSTTGDAELADIRVGANGTTYPNAGGAVRGQISELKSDIGEFDFDGEDITFEIGTLYNGWDNSSTTRIRSGYIRADAGTKVKMEYAGNPSRMIVVWSYDKNKKNPLASNSGNWSEYSIDYTLERDGYIRLVIAYTTPKTITDDNMPFLYSKLKVDRKYEILNNTFEHERAISSNASAISSNASAIEKIESIYNGNFIADSDVNVKGIDLYSETLSNVSEKNYTCLFFTDPHMWYTSKTFYTNNVKALNNMQKAYNMAHFQDVVCGGDLLNTDASKSVAKYQLSYVTSLFNYLFRDNCHFVYGNHDGNDTLGTRDDERLSFDEVARLTVNNYADNLYYSYEKNNCKVIVLNTGNEVNTGYSNYPVLLAIPYIYQELMNYSGDVVIYMHMAYNITENNPLYEFTEVLLNFFNANNTRSTFNYGDAYDFTNSNSKVVAILSGHTHKYIANTYNGIPIISGKNANTDAKNGDFYYVIFDFENRKLHVIDNDLNTKNTYDLVS